MDDIVKRLRTKHAHSFGVYCSDLESEAATEIEQLRMECDVLKERVAHLDNRVHNANTAAKVYRDQRDEWARDFET